MAKNVIPQSDADRIADLEGQVACLNKALDIAKKDEMQHQRLAEQARRECEVEVQRARDRYQVLSMRMTALRRVLEAAELLASDENAPRPVGEFYGMVRTK